MKLFLTFLIAAISAVVVNLIILFIGKPTAGTTGVLGPLEVGPVVMWTILGCIGATLVFMLVRKFSKAPKIMFTWISIFVLLLLFIPDVLIKSAPVAMQAGVTWNAVLLLMVMHVAVAAVIVPALLRSLPEGSR